MKTIGIVSAHFLPHLGGVERYTYNLAKSFIHMGKKVVIITSLIEDLPCKEEIEGIIIYRLPSFSFMKGRMPVLNLNKECKSKIREIEQEQLDGIIINTHLYTLSCWGAYWGGKKARKVILLEHGTAHMDLGRIWLNQVGRIYEHLLMYVIKRYVSDFYGVSLACNKWLKHFGIKGKGVFYNAVDWEDLKEIKPYYRDKLQIEKEKVILTFAGRLIEEKGIRKLCEAFEQLDKKKVCLIVAGDGALYLELKQRYPDVFWLGSIEHKQVMCLLSETDIYILPTDYPEGFPTTVLEAAMCGCSIITTDVGGTKELIRDTSYGILMKENSISEIKEELEKLLKNPEKIRQMGERVQIRVKSHFTWDVTIKRVIKEFNE